MVVPGQRPAQSTPQGGQQGALVLILALCRNSTGAELVSLSGHDMERVSGEGDLAVATTVHV